MSTINKIKINGKVYDVGGGGASEELLQRLEALESTVVLLKYPYALILDRGAFDYFCYGDGVLSDAISVDINGERGLTVPDFVEVNGKFICELAKGDRVEITNRETCDIYVATDVDHIFISKAENGGDLLRMDDSVTLQVGKAGGGYTANIYTTDRGESMTWIQNDADWEMGNGDYGIRVTKADGSVQYLNHDDFSDDITDDGMDVVMGRELYRATVENAVSVEFQGNGYVPEVWLYNAEMDSFEQVACDTYTHTFTQDDERIAVEFT